MFLGIKMHIWHCSLDFYQQSTPASSTGLQLKLRCAVISLEKPVKLDQVATTPKWQH